MRKIKPIAPSWCLGKCEEEEYKCCRCGSELKISYQVGDGKRLHSLCNRCYNFLKDNKGIVGEEGVKE